MTRLILNLALAAAAAAVLAAPTGAQAHGRNGPSQASALSMLPLAVSAAAPAVMISAGASFVVLTVSAVGEGTVWVLERASDGARFSVTVAASAVGAVSVATGAVVTTVACSAGWVLSSAGQVIAFIPNELGKALLHNERVTR
jgi:hypothetical protein